MTRQDDFKELMALWQAKVDEGEDPIRILVEYAVQKIMELEFTEFLGAESGERTGTRRGYRNGYRPRTLTTRVGKLELLVPRDREGRFSPELFQRYQRSEKGFVLALMEMYVQGVSTRRVKKITEQLCGIEVSSSQVSKLSSNLDEHIKAWRSRRIEHEYRYLIVDAMFEKVRHGAEVLSDAVLVVTGIRDDGYRQHLGVWMGNTESEATWSDVFSDLKDRGLRGVRYVVSDKHKGIEAAIARHFQGAIWNRCQVHFKRNVCSRVRRQDQEWAASLIRDITDAPTIDKARKLQRKAAEGFSERYPDVARMVDEEGEEMLAVYALPPGHRRRMRSTNMLERWFEEIRRRTKVIRIFPNRASCIRLVGTHCIEANEEWLGRRYLNMEREEVERELEKIFYSASEGAPVPSAPSEAAVVEM